MSAGQEDAESAALGEGLTGRPQDAPGGLLRHGMVANGSRLRGQSPRLVPTRLALAIQG